MAIESLINFYKESPFLFGTADVFCCGPFDSTDRLGELIWVLYRMTDAEGQHVISRITVVLPPRPGNEAEGDDSGVCSAINQTTVKLRGYELTREEEDRIAKLVKVVYSPDLQARSVFKLLQDAENRSVFVVLDAARYRESSVRPPRLRKGAIAGLPEDVWVAHLHALVKGSISIAQKASCYVLLDAGEPWPYRADNIELLRSIENCSVLARRVKNDPWQIIAEHLDEWIAEIAAGRLGSVFSSIDKLPDSLASQKGILKIQLLSSAVPQAHAPLIELIRAELKTRNHIDAEIRVKLARMAENAGYSDLASDLLVQAIPMLTSQEWLESALLISRDIGSYSLEDACLKRLEECFPESYQLHWQRLTALIYSQQYDEAVSMLGKDIPGIPSEDAAFYSRLAALLGTSGQPDYQVLLDDVRGEWPAMAIQAQLICIEDARSRQLLREALALAMSIELAGPQARQSAAVILRSVRELLLLRNDDGELRVNPQELCQPVVKIVRYLSANASDGETRLALIRLLSVPITGLFGLPIVAAVVLNLVRETSVSFGNGTSRHAATRNERIDLVAFVQIALEWLAKESPILVGRSVLPSELLPASPEQMMLEVNDLVQYFGNRLETDADVTLFEKLIFVGLVVAPRSNDPGDDLELLRLGAGKLAIAGRVQRARDLAEQTLQIAGDHSLRSRLAWYSYADIYHRLRNLTEAMVAIACALACDVEITAEQAFYETHLLIRLLRDLHLTAMAKSLLPTSKRLLESLGLEEENGHRLITVELGLRMSELADNPKPSPEEVGVLVSEIEEHCRQILERDNEIAPAGVLLGHAIYLSTRCNLPVDTSVLSTLDKVLSQVNEPLASTIRTITALVPSAADVFALNAGLEAARFSEDAGFDIQNVAVAARRLLAADEAINTPEIAAFTIELLADQAVGKTSAWDDASEHQQRLLSSMEAPLKYAREFSESGVSVNLLGISSSRGLIRVTLENEVINVACEDTAVFSKEKLDAWSTEFPYKYGVDFETVNLFYTSMTGLGITAQCSKRMLLVMDTALQQLPPNLILISDDFIGKKVPVASAPSLSWLAKSRSAQRIRSGRSIAWIPYTTGNCENATLEMVAERLKPSLETHNITLHTNAEVPEDLVGSELVVVAAHGGITPWGSFFQVIADDADFRVPSGAISGAMRNVGIAILFVCNAGRFDEHPQSSTTVGLARDLLNKGCSTVIASPWSLDSRVPSHWLPRFLEVWMEKRPAIDANFEANKAVEQAMGDSPAYCLAMTVFGDPLTVKS